MPVGVVGDDLRARHQRQRGADRDRAKQITYPRVRTQIGADALPQIVDAAAAPVLLRHEAAAQFHALRDPRQRVLAVVEQAGGVEPAQAVRRQHRRAAGDAVGAGDAGGRLVPQHDVFVPAVPGVEVEAAAGTFAHRAEGQLAQPADLVQQRRVHRQRADPDLLAVAGPAEQAQPGHGRANQRRVDGRGHRFGAAGGRPGALPAGAQRIELAADLPQQCLVAGIGRDRTRRCPPAAAPGARGGRTSRAPAAPFPPA